ncbi:MAG: acyl carrier protein [Gammaproteobacteria bacterium]|nr:acyl carrier protein [Gammaproteobacteria bacterium]
MTTNSLSDTVIGVISQVCELPASDITLQSSFEDLNISSLDVVTIAFELEEELDIKLPDDEIYNIKTVKELIDNLHLLMNELETS